MTGDLDDHVRLDSTALDSMETGREFSAGDLVLLAVMGIVVPIVLLVWGWL